MTFIKKISFFNQIRKTLNLLPPIQRRKAGISGFLILCGTVLDLVSLAAVVPIFLLILDSSLIHTNFFLSSVYQLLGFISDKQFIIASVIVILAIFVVKNLALIFITHYQSRFAYEVATDLSEISFKNYFNENYLSHISDHSTFQARNIQQIPIEFSVYVLLASINFAAEFLIFAAVLIAMMLLNINNFLLLTVVLTPPLLLIYFFKKNKLKNIGEKLHRLKPSSMKSLYQGIQSYTDSKLFQKENYFVKQFMEAQGKLNQTFARHHTVGAVPSRLIEIAAVLGLAAILTYGILFVGDKENIIFTVSLFTVGAYRVLPSINRMSISLVNIKTHKYTIDVLKNVLFVNHDEMENGEQYIAKKLDFDESISCKDISFSYTSNHRFQLEGINFTVNKGETVGFIGKSGAGKTTLMNILLRLLIEESGQVYVDGVPIDKENKIAWQNLIGHVSQNPFILDGTIADNIAFGEKENQRNPDLLNKAVRQAGLEELIAKLPECLNERIGENGVFLSNGQKQRIAIARALYRDAQVFFFDEATSEIDTQTENEILESIQHLAQQNKTIFIIAHRLSTLKKCDRIYKLEDGRIIETCGYSELIKKELGYIQDPIIAGD